MTCDRLTALSLYLFPLSYCRNRKAKQRTETTKTKESKYNIQTSKQKDRQTNKQTKLVINYCKPRKERDDLIKSFGILKSITPVLAIARLCHRHFRSLLLCYRPTHSLAHSPKRNETK